MITQAQLKAVLDYNPRSGVFTAKQRVGKWNVGDVVGLVRPNGYHFIGLGYKKYRAHRLAWLWVHGSFPPVSIDHINRVRDDNRIANLRLATAAEQRQNRSNTRGCYQTTKGGRWAARINVGGVKTHLGSFGSEAEARAAYLAAKKVIHKFNPEL